MVSKKPVKATGLAWAGIRTGAYDAMVRLFHDGLGLELTHEDHEFAGLMLPNGDKIEVFGLSDAEHTHFDSGPVVGFSSTTSPPPGRSWRR